MCSAGLVFIRKDSEFHRSIKEIYNSINFTTWQGLYELRESSNALKSLDLMIAGWQLLVMSYHSSYDFLRQFAFFSTNFTLSSLSTMAVLAFKLGIGPTF
jgi:hypothetical protein